MTTTPTSGAADLPEALRRSTAADGKTELFNLPGYPLMVRAVDFNRIHTESEMRRAALLDEMQKAALAAGQATAAQQPDSENLRKALKFYGDGEHFIKADDTAWDTVSGEPQNYWCDEAGTATVEDGHIARLALSGHLVRFEDDAAQPAAQQPSTVYAALPEYGINTASHAHFRVLGFTADQLRAFADATCALRASRGQAPAQHTGPCVVCGSDEPFTGTCGSRDPRALCKQPSTTAQSADSVPAVSDLPPLPAPDLRDIGTKPQEIKEFLKGYATEYARTAIAARAPADSVQEDAALWHWLAEYLVGTRTDLDDEIVACESVHDLRMLVEAARKQGEKQ